MAGAGITLICRLVFGLHSIGEADGMTVLIITEAMVIGMEIITAEIIL